MTGLAGERCQACHGDTPPLPEAEVEELLEQLSGAWDRSGALIRRHIQTRDFAESFSLATRVALLAEREGHHPELQVGWGHLVVELTTHAAGGLTRNDFIMAAKVDRVIGPAPDEPRP